ncbi:MAG: LapA family protein [Deltaproteobacteria bacterium]|nr:LapA family protein [Deltaproteobacteria bacterium]
MKKAKLIIWLLVLGLMGLVIFQNEDHFLNAQQSLRLNLGVFPEYHSPQLPMVFFYLTFFLYGLLVAYGFGLPERFRKRKTIKRLTIADAQRAKEMAELNTELARIKGEPPPYVQAGTDESSITSPVKAR